MNVTVEETDAVIAAIREYLPSDIEVFFFGSRVDGTFHKGSDLDVLLKGIAPIHLGLLSLIKEKLDGSDIPFKVDILDYHRCSKEMIENIFKSIVKISPPEKKE